MPQTITYFVKRDPGLFRKSRWVILMDKLKIGERESEAEALEMATAEAERSAELGRVVEVWANNGEGFVLYKSLQPVRKKKGDDDAGDDDSGGEASRGDDDDAALAAAIL